MDKYSEAPKMYESGLSVGEVAAYYGITRQAMWKILLRRGVTMRPQRQTGADHFRREQQNQSKRASHLVEMAVRKGVLVPAPCEVCGKTNDVRAHHDDYNQPLAVRWLCGLHHYEWHEAHTAVPLAAPLPTLERERIAALGGQNSWAHLTPEQRVERIRKATETRRANKNGSW